MRIAVVGAGAIGTWLAAALARAGEDVALLGRNGPIRALQVSGTEQYEATAAAELELPFDAVILSTKAHDVPGAADTVNGLLGPDAPVVAAQNGVPWWLHGDAGGLDSARALGMVVYMGASVLAPGHVTTRAEAGLIVGEPDGFETPRLRAVSAALEGAGFAVRVTGDIRTELWTKLMGNAAFNLLSVLTRCGLGTLARDEHTRAIAAEIMHETVAVARATGANPTMAVEDRLALSARLGDHKPSTLQDLEAGKRLELDAIGGAIVELAALHDVPVPTLQRVYALAELQARALGLR
jgi:2-dehydropantoate 2-reductase